MKQLFFVLSFVLFIQGSYAEHYLEYFYNDSTNNYFYKLIQQKHKGAKNIAHINYFRSFVFNGTNYVDSFTISNAGKKNYLLKNDDSLIILKYILNHDSSLFQIRGPAIVLVKKNKAEYYTYYNPIKEYNRKTIDSIYNYPIDFMKEYDPGNYVHYSEITKMNYVTFTLENDRYYKLVLDIRFSKGKIKSIKPLGMIIYQDFYESSRGKYIGRLGIGCFIFKN